MSRMLMGHPAGLVASDPAGLQAPWIGSANATMTSWSGPWGRSYTSNLTPDAETGIGTWTEQQFIDTIRNGKHLGNGRALLPPMPWPAFRHLADDDLAAMFAYLRTIPAIRNKVPDPVLPPGPAASEPALPAITLTLAPSHADPVARGRYLVTAKGCGDCHTPMTMGAQGPEYDLTRTLAGFDARGAVPPMPPVKGAAEVYVLEPAFAGEWGMSFAANLTPDAETGIGTWTEQQFLDTLRNGRHQGRGRQLLPPMPWQVFGQMTDADLKAVFAYLKTITPVKNKVPDPLPPVPLSISGR
jgi:mono/diheme cytochrome c family protein